jgi:protein ImuA
MPITVLNREILVRRIAQLEAAGERHNGKVTTVPLQCAVIDAVLPGGGLRTGSVHEVLGPIASNDKTPGRSSPPSQDRRGDGAAMGFVCAMLARLMQAQEAGRGLTVWCMNERWRYRKGSISGRAFAPGLHGFGIAAQRLLFVASGNDDETLWVTEEVLRSTAVGTVVAELYDLNALAARRLQLAAQASATTVLALRSSHAASAGGFAETRWRAANLANGAHLALSATTAGFGPWQVDLLRARRSAASGSWSVHWQNRRLLVAQHLADDASASGLERMTRL